MVKAKLFVAVLSLLMAHGQTGIAFADADEAIEEVCDPIGRIITGYDEGKIICDGDEITASLDEESEILCFSDRTVTVITEDSDSSTVCAPSEVSICYEEGTETVCFAPRGTVLEIALSSSTEGTRVQVSWEDIVDSSSYLVRASGLSGGVLKEVTQAESSITFEDVDETTLISVFALADERVVIAQGSLLIGPDEG